MPGKNRPAPSPAAQSTQCRGRGRPPVARTRGLQALALDDERTAPLLSDGLLGTRRHARSASAGARRNAARSAEAVDEISRRARDSAEIVPLDVEGKWSALRIPAANACSRAFVPR